MGTSRRLRRTTQALSNEVSLAQSYIHLPLIYLLNLDASACALESKIDQLADDTILHSLHLCYFPRDHVCLPPKDSLIHISKDIPKERTSFLLSTCLIYFPPRKRISQVISLLKMNLLFVHSSFIFKATHHDSIGFVAGAGEEHSQVFPILDDELKLNRWKIEPLVERFQDIVHPPCTSPTRWFCSRQF